MHIDRRTPISHLASYHMYYLIAHSSATILPRPLVLSQSLSVLMRKPCDAARGRWLRIWLCGGSDSSKQLPMRQIVV